MVHSLNVRASLAMSLIVVPLDKRHYLLACGFSGFAMSTWILLCEDRVVHFLIAW